VKVLSALKLYDKFDGSPTLIRNAFIACGEPAPSIVAICLWKLRRSIPGHWAGSLLYTLACHGINPLDILDDLAVPQTEVGAS
jgi:hypothetical protein